MISLPPVFQVNALEAHAAKPAFEAGAAIGVQPMTEKWRTGVVLKISRHDLHCLYIGVPSYFLFYYLLAMMLYIYDVGRNQVLW